MYCSNKIIKIGVCSAIIAFNDGFYGLEKIVPERQALPQKKASKHLRKRHLDMTAEKEEEESYKSGAF